MADPDLLTARRRLAGELRRARLNAGLSTHQVAAAIRVSQSQVSKIENATRSASIPVVRAWAEATGVADPTVDDWVRLAEQALDDFLARRAIFRSSGGVAAHQRQIGELERACRLIREFEPVFIPGLLQTADYARQAMTSVRGEHDRVGASVAARIDRQAVLYDQTKQFGFVIAEAALRWRLGAPGSHLAQLDRLAVVMTLPNVDVAIIPQVTATAAWHGHGFVLFEHADSEDADTLAYVETLTQELKLSDPDEVAVYRAVFERLRSEAATGENARRLLTTVMADMRQLDA